MPFTDFIPDSVQTKLGVKISLGQLFPDLHPVSEPDWLSTMVAKTCFYARLNEKSRNAFIVAPILVAVRELSGDTITIMSGQHLDVDPEKGLTGECDFILVPENTIPILQSPLLIILQAKNGDVERGVGECVAQMVAAQAFNERSGLVNKIVFGCVTTGEIWQFLRLIGTSVVVNHDRLYLDKLGRILAALLRAVGHPGTL